MTCEGGGSLEIYLEPFLPKPQLVVIGSSPVAETLAQLGLLLDFKVIVAETDLSSVKDQINESSYVVIATMGNRDEEGLLAVIGTRPKYLGLVASKKKSEALFEYARLVRADFRQYVASTDDARAAEAMTVALPDGNSYVMPRRQLAVHVILHEIRHLAQLALAARLAGHAPPGEHDLFYFNVAR
jgi:hypothetical protein